MRIYLDFDGPVVDNRAKYYALYRDALAEQAAGVEPLAQQRYWDLKRHRVPDPEICALTSPDVDSAAYLAYRDRWIEDERYTSRDVLVDGLAVAASRWRAAGHEVRIATMRKRGETLRAELARLGVEAWCDRVLQTEANNGHWGAKARMLRDDLGDLDAGGASGPAVLVGDTEGDIMAARDSGILVAVVTNGIRAEALLRLFEPDAVLPVSTAFDPAAFG